MNRILSKLTSIKLRISMSQNFKLHFVLKRLTYSLIVVMWSLLACHTEAPDEKKYRTDVLVIGDGTGAIAAAIASARQGASTMMITELPWLGGMLTSAGVSASDGNHWMPAGLWGEFRDSLRLRYRGADSLATGWISFTLFEPKVGASIFDNLASREAALTVLRETQWKSIEKEGDQWKVLISHDDKISEVRAKILVDGTDLGDIAAEAGASYDLGMDSRNQSGETMAPLEANDIIQDLTYVAILKDYGPDGAPVVTPSPEYDRKKYLCACQTLCDDPAIHPHPCSTMLTYAKLPRQKYMINWPNYGNDYYCNLIDLSPQERTAKLQGAKRQTLDFIYFIQNELGYRNLGLAKDEFPTEDHLPLMPYHREGRRINGLVRLNVNQILDPYAEGHESFMSGIAVGDYPIDHHHNQKPEAPEIDFPPVPSFNIPLGCLISRDIDHLLIADKAMSVTNIVNGASRLQPVILQVGQASGIAAAICSQSEKSVYDLNIREVQMAVLNQGGYLMPYFDVPPEHPHFISIQKVGATGILRGIGEPFQWANRTWFLPDSLATFGDLKRIEKIYPVRFIDKPDQSPVDLADLKQVAGQINGINIKPAQFDEIEIKENTPLTRAQLALCLDKVFRIFEEDQIQWNGKPARSASE